MKHVYQLFTLLFALTILSFSSSYATFSVTSISPNTNALNISPSTNIVVTFDGPVDTASLNSYNFNISGSVSGVHNGNFSFSNANATVTFNPNVDFKNGEIVTVDLSSQLTGEGLIFLDPPVTRQFTIMSTTSSGAFGGQVNYPTGTTPDGVTLYDLDADGDADAVVANSGDNTISVFMNNGNGTFAPKVNYTTGTTPYKVAIADLNSDGYGDIVVANYSANTVSVFINNGNGTFAAKADYGTGNSPIAIAITDMDRDGANDIVVANRYGNSVSLLKNLTNGTFANQFETADISEIQPLSVSIADINGDGFPDVLCANQSSNSVSVYNNDGFGNLFSGAHYSTGNEPYDATLSDIDGDGDLDIIVANNLGYSISVLKNDGTGNFAARVDYPNGGGVHSEDSYSLNVADIDGDGDNDVITTNWYNGYSLSILKNNGDGSFASPVLHYIGGTDHRFSAIGDLDGDGDVDIVTTCDDGYIIVSKNLNTIVTTTTPARNAINVASATNIVVNFSGVMNPTTFNTSSFNVTGSVSGTHTGTRSLTNGNTTAVFQPSPAIRFIAGEIVTVLLTGSVQDAGNYNLEPFMFQYTVASKPSTGSFATNVDYPVDGVSYHFSTADMDGDGNVDLVIPSAFNNTLSILKNNGGGIFAPKVDYGAGNYDYSVATGDIDGDGDIDAVTANSNDNTLSVFKNNGDGTLATAIPYSTGIYPYSIAMGDIDGDGDQDLIVGNEGDVSISIFKNNGDGTFATKVDYGVGGFSYALVTADVDGDGDLDVITANLSSNTITVLKNIGDGTFAAHTEYGTGLYVFSLAAGDVDGDGDMDIVTANKDGNSISVLKNNGNGIFASKVDYTTDTSPQDVFIRDIDGDGDGDVVTANWGASTISLLKNNGNGTFAGKVDYTTPGNPTAITISDVNGDGNPEIIVQNNLSISVFKNLSTKVTSITPLQNALSISPSANIVMNFSGALNALSFNDTVSFVVTGSASGRHQGGFSFSNGVTTATFNPTVDFKAGEVVTVNVSTKVKDATNAGVAAFSSQFTVATTASFGIFAAKVDYPVGTNPWAAYINDVDNDGDADLVIPNFSDNSVSVLKNNGDGTFGTKVDYTTGINPHSVFVKDVNNDGFSDIVTVNLNSSTFSVFINSGDGTFAPKVDYTSIFSHSIYIYDVNGDGYPDVLTGRQNSGEVYISMNNGNGTFAAPVSYNTGLSVFSIAVSDIDGDGDGDIITANYGAGTVSVLKNLGDGTFAAGVNYPVDAFPYSVFATDIDADGDADIIVANLGSSTVSVLKNNGDGTYAAQVDYATGGSPYSVTVNDIDGDGDGDILTANGNANTVSVLKNNGNGTFTAPSDFTTGNNAHGISAGDIDGDGRNDILVTNFNDNSISVLKNLSSISVVSGQFFNDLNNNGVKEGGEPGLQGWNARLFGFTVDTVVIDTAVTDSNGMYSFTNVPAGNYTLSELAQAGWVQTLPALQGTYSFAITNLDTIIDKDFGNGKPGIIITPPPDSSISWNDSTIWNGNHIPTASDTVVIPPNVSVTLNTDSLTQGHNTIGTLIVPDGSSILTSGNATFNILGNFNVNGGFIIDSTASPTINCNGNFIVTGTFTPGASTVDLTGDSMQIVGDSISPIVPPKQQAGSGNSTFTTGVPRTSFHNLTIDNEFAITAGTLVINNTLSLNRDLTIGLQPGNVPDTLLIQNGAPNAVTGTGRIHNGTMKRRIFTGQPGKTALKYQFHDVNTAIELDSAGTNPASITVTKTPTISSFGNQYATFKGGIIDSVNKFVKVSGIRNFSRWTFGQVGYKDNTGGPTYDISADTVAIAKAGGNSVSAFTAGTVSLTYDPALLNGNPQSGLGLWKTASAIKVNVVRDEDGIAASTNDRTGKQWNVTIYKNSVSPANLITSANSSTMLADDIGTGNFIVQVADTSNWNAIQHTVNTTTTNDTAHRVTVSLLEGRYDSLIFVLSPDQTSFRTFKESVTDFKAKVVKLAYKKGKLAAQPNILTAISNVFAKRVPKAGATFLGISQLYNKDSTKKYSWIDCKTPADIAKGFSALHTGQSYPLDYLRDNIKGTKKKLAKAVKFTASLNNPAIAQGILLKLNILASDSGITPRGFGSLVIDTSLQLAGREIKGMSLIKFAEYYDSVMTYWKRFHVDTLEAYTNLGTVVSYFLKPVNDGFYAPMSNNYVVDSGSVVSKDKLKKNVYAVSLTGVATPLQVGKVKRVSGKNDEIHLTPANMDEIPNTLVLQQNYPNPFNPLTVIGYSLSMNSVVSLKVYDVLGREVTTLINNETMEEGAHEVSFNASSLSSGVYFYRITAKGENGQVFSQAKKLVLIK